MSTDKLNASATLTLDSIREAVKQIEMNYEKAQQTEIFECKKCGNKQSVQNYQLGAYFRTYPDGVFATCENCIIDILEGK